METPPGLDVSVEEVVEGVLWRVFQSDAPEPSHLADPSSLLARLPHLTRKMKNMSVQLVKKNPLPELSEDLDMFTGKEPCLSESPVGESREKRWYSGTETRTEIVVPSLANMQTSQTRQIGRAHV